MVNPVVGDGVRVGKVVCPVVPRVVKPVVWPVVIGPVVKVVCPVVDCREVRGGRVDLVERVPVVDCPVVDGLVVPPVA